VPAIRRGSRPETDLFTFNLCLSSQSEVKNG
jgi:hypothetical protein